VFVALVSLLREALIGDQRGGDFFPSTPHQLFSFEMIV